MGAGSSSQTSSPMFQSFPGAWGPSPSTGGSPGTPIVNRKAGGGSGMFTPSTADYTRSAQFGDMLAQLVGQQSPYQQPMQNAILNPSFNPNTASETALLNSIMDVTGGRSAVRGLGPPTAGALAQDIAPALIGLRQQDIANMGAGRGQDLQSQALQAGILEQLIGYAMPQIAGGTTSSGSGKQFKLI